MRLPKTKGLEDRSFLPARVDVYGSYLCAGIFLLGLRVTKPPTPGRFKEALADYGFPGEKVIIGGDLNDLESSAPISSAGRLWLFNRNSTYKAPIGPTAADRLGL